jgi:hypothetical protein
VVTHDASHGVGVAMRTGYLAALARGADICVKKTISYRGSATRGEAPC